MTQNIDGQNITRGIFFMSLQVMIQVRLSFSYFVSGFDCAFDWYEMMNILWF